MDKPLMVALPLLLLICHSGSSSNGSSSNGSSSNGSSSSSSSSNTELRPSCPYRCQCFTPQQVLCAEDRMVSLPTGLSRQVKEVIVMTSALAYLLPLSLEESPQLTKLVFLNNALRSIHTQALESLTELQELEISGNPWLEVLFLGTFSQQRNLTKLLLNYNRFKAMLPGTFEAQRQLETLQMKGNFISRLPDFLFLNLHNLRFLDLSLNKLEEVKRETFSGLNGLKVLKMNNNLIGNLTADVFHDIPQLTELHLEFNNISELRDGIFSMLTQLNVLNLRGNILTTFTGQVFGFSATNLTELNLRGNRLTQLSSLHHLTSLTDLILSSNRLSVLPEELLRNITELENLDLSENQLSLLPAGIFRKLFSLNAIHLHKNSLNHLDPKLFQDQMLLQQLYLSDNRLKSLPFGLLDPFLTQNTVGLHGNPWRCDCHMWYLHDWVLSNFQNVDMPEHLLCDSPGFLRRQALASVDKEQLVCPVSAGQMPDVRSCSIQAVNDTVVVKCRVDTCSPLKVKVQFEEGDGNTREHVLKNQSPECSNDTGIDDGPAP